MGGGYATLSGTSMATPFVTGLSALLFGQSPSRTPADVKTLLASTSDKVGNTAYGPDPYGTCSGCTWNGPYGYGRIDVLQALEGTVPGPDFTIGIQPGSATIKRGRTVSYTVTVGAQNGFAGTVSLSVAGLPAGATSSFTPAAVSGSGSATLRITPAPTTPRGSVVFSVTGTSGSLVHSASATLTVK
jgi:subtilisin family serine protease